MWRLVIDERIPDGLYQIEEFWSLEDVYRAHSVLDAYDDAMKRAREQAERKARRGRR